MNRSASVIARMGLFVAMLSVLSYLIIPLPFSPVPFTGQMVGIFLTGIILGGKNGALTVFIYLLLGAIGLPVFAGGRGGLQVILGPTGGYLMGFIPGIFALGSISSIRSKISNKKSPSRFINQIIGMLVCLFIVYLWGGLQLSFVMNLDFKQTLLAGIIPYIPLDLLKVVVTAPLVNKLQKSILPFEG